MMQVTTRTLAAHHQYICVEAVVLKLASAELGAPSFCREGLCNPDAVAVCCLL